MTFNKTFVIVTVSLLITIVLDVSSCGHSRSWKTRHHKHRRHPRHVGNNEIGYATSCGESLCTMLTPAYPKRKITSAWKEFDRLVSSNRTAFQRVMVDTGFLQKVIYQNNENDYLKEILKDYKCKTETNIIYPVEGQSIDDNELYYIINLPYFPQNVEKKICKSCEPDDELVSCEQHIRKEKLLAIPVRKHSFKAEDVTVKSFEVPYSCVCSIV